MVCPFFHHILPYFLGQNPEPEFKKTHIIYLFTLRIYLWEIVKDIKAEILHHIYEIISEINISS